MLPPLQAAFLHFPGRLDTLSLSPPALTVLLESNHGTVTEIGFTQVSTVAARCFGGRVGVRRLPLETAPSPISLDGGLIEDTHAAGFCSDQMAGMCRNIYRITAPCKYMTVLYSLYLEGRMK